MPANATGNSSDPPQLVEDKTIKSETVATDETTTAEPVEKKEKVPKAFDFNLPAAQSVESGQIKIHSFGVEQIIPLRKPQGYYLLNSKRVYFDLTTLYRLSCWKVKIKSLWNLFLFLNRFSGGGFVCSYSLRFNSFVFNKLRRV